MWIGLIIWVAGIIISTVIHYKKFKWMNLYERKWFFACIVFWLNLESIVQYFLGYFFRHNEETDKIFSSPEEIWGLFLHELDELFNAKGMQLDYALGTASSIVFCRTNIDVLNDSTFKVFTYYDTIFDKIQNRYIELLDNYFNVANYDFSSAVRKAKEHVKEEFHIPDKDFDNMEEVYGFNERQIINAV